MTDDQILERAAEIIEERCRPMIIVRGWTKQLRRLAVQIRDEQAARARRRTTAGLCGKPCGWGIEPDRPCVLPAVHVGQCWPV